MNGRDELRGRLEKLLVRGHTDWCQNEAIADTCECWYGDLRAILDDWPAPPAAEAGAAAASAAIDLACAVERCNEIIEATGGSLMDEIREPFRRWKEASRLSAPAAASEPPPIWTCESCGKDFGNATGAHTRTERDPDGHAYPVLCGPVSRREPPPAAPAQTDTHAPTNPQETEL